MRELQVGLQRSFRLAFLQAPGVALQVRTQPGARLLAEVRFFFSIEFGGFVALSHAGERRRTGSMITMPLSRVRRYFRRGFEGLLVKVNRGDMALLVGMTD